jgi:Amidohydrolase
LAARKQRSARRSPAFPNLLDLVRSGKAYVKVSGAYRASTQAPDYPYAAPLAKALIAANADRIVWGTDWPHPNSDTPAGKQATDITHCFKLTAPYPIAGLGARWCHAQEDLGRQSGAAQRPHLALISKHQESYVLMHANHFDFG